MKKIFKNILAMTLAAAMTIPLAACSEGGGSTPNEANSGNNGSNDSAKQDKIVVWTLANDLKQFAERYTNETGNEVEVIVYDSADFKTNYRIAVDVRQRFERCYRHRRGDLEKADDDGNKRQDRSARFRGCAGTAVRVAEARERRIRGSADGKIFRRR